MGNAQTSFTHLRQCEGSAPSGPVPLASRLAGAHALSKNEQEVVTKLWSLGCGASFWIHRGAEDQRDPAGIRVVSLQPTEAQLRSQAAVISAGEVPVQVSKCQAPSIVLHAAVVSYVVLVPSQSGCRSWLICSDSGTVPVGSEGLEAPPV